MINLRLIWILADNKFISLGEFFCMIENKSPLISLCQCLSFSVISLCCRAVKMSTPAFPGQQELHFTLFFKTTQIQGIQNPPESSLERGLEQGMKKPESHIRWQLFLLQGDSNFLNTG